MQLDRFSKSELIVRLSISILCFFVAVSIAILFLPQFQKMAGQNFDYSLLILVLLGIGWMLVMSILMALTTFSEKFDYKLSGKMARTNPLICVE